MAGFSTDITTTRGTPPDPVALLAQLRAAFNNTVGFHDFGGGQWRLKKATAWTAQQRVNAQRVLDTAPNLTPARRAQNQVDAMTLFERAVVLTLLDEINGLRERAGLQPRTLAQVIEALREKAGSAP